MADHPFLGVVLFAIGTLMVAAAYYTSNAQSILLGHIIAFNGVLLVVLGCNKLQSAKSMTARRSVKPPSRTFSWMGDQPGLSAQVVSRPVSMKRVIESKRPSS